MIIDSNWELSWPGVSDSGADPAGAGRARDAPAKGAKFYLTDRHNANSRGQYPAHRRRPEYEQLAFKIKWLWNTTGGAQAG